MLNFTSDSCSAIKMTMEDVLTRYYLSQAGSGIGDFYSGPIYQRGYGIGSFLGGLFRTALPLLRRGGIAVTKELLSGGTNFLNDIENNISPRSAFNNRASETVSNLKRKVMHGEGFIPIGRAKKRHLGSVRRAVKTKRRVVKKKPKSQKKKKRVSKKKNYDIFN